MGAQASTMQTQMQTEHDPNAAFPWWVRYLAKALGIIGGFIAIFFAILGLLSFTATCIMACIIQLATGFLTIALEAPVCCSFVDFIDRIAQFSESRAYWHKAALFAGMGVVPILMCPELNTILGSGLIFGCGLAYGVMSLGKKADRTMMMGGGSDPAWSPQVNLPTGPPVGFNQP